MEINYIQIQLRICFRYTWTADSKYIKVWSIELNCHYITTIETIYQIITKMSRYIRGLTYIYFSQVELNNTCRQIIDHAMRGRTVFLQKET